jgi:hypothetical protein
MFTAYFDASGTKRTKVLTVAGFVSSVPKWNRFEKQWAEILAAYGITFFHMTEFASSTGEFKSWKGETAKRKEFIELLVDCIRRHTKKGFASSIVLADYNEINAKFLLSERAGQPFTMCGIACLWSVRDWAEKHKLDAKQLLYMIEDGDEDQGELMARVKKDGYKIIPLAKSDANAFQAGDLVGWKARTAIHNAFSKGSISQQEGENILRSLKPIEPVVQGNHGYTREILLQICADFRIPRRRGTTAI